MAADIGISITLVPCLYIDNCSGQGTIPHLSVDNSVRAFFHAIHCSMSVVDSDRSWLPPILGELIGTDVSVPVEHNLSTMLTSSEQWSIHIEGGIRSYANTDTFDEVDTCTRTFDDCSTKYLDVTSI